MTEDIFLKKSYKAYMPINYLGRNTTLECMLIKIDFEEYL